jgi:MinD-like ATPase involved in chromosome partitioning or flagellar assembly
VKPDDVPRIVHQDVFWTIPYDEQVLFSNSIGQPIVMAKPKSGAARQLRGLAQKITGGVAEEAGGGFSLPRFLKPWTFLRRRAA